MARATRRLGSENADTRAALIEAAAKIVQDEGYAAVSARRLADELGLKRQIVHYYFGTIEELLIALIRRDGEAMRDRLLKALNADDPLTALWGMEAVDAIVMFEFTALACRRPAVKQEMKKYTEDFRKIITRVLEADMKRRGVLDSSSISPLAVAVILVNISTGLAIERSLGIDMGHAETRRLLGEWLGAHLFGPSGQ
ncbi:TetR/AcrR family transcriptional regulator [Mycobacterium sp.]|uniref:TetR/AcrR family transcriptional regulator n=1 Tax=Mycobacterium sp. TaxID=1785 RepID=UPI002D8D6BC4|nr:TetR/AcrR family transcriptional regulator [Mycobacterium sp.]